jgi:hypothetical protein
MNSSPRRDGSTARKLRSSPRREESTRRAVRSDVDLYLKHPRPPMLRDHFNPQLHKIFSFRPKLQQITVRFEISEADVPAFHKNERASASRVGYSLLRLSVERLSVWAARSIPERCEPRTSTIGFLVRSSHGLPGFTARSGQLGVGCRTSQMNRRYHQVVSLRDSSSQKTGFLRK